MPSSMWAIAVCLLLLLLLGLSGYSLYQQKQANDALLAELNVREGRLASVEQQAAKTAGALATAQSRVNELLAEDWKKILINLRKVTIMDSSGIGELVSGYTTVKNQGGEVKLLNLTKKVHDLLQITKLYTVFEVFDDEATAVRSYK